MKTLQESIMDNDEELDKKTGESKLLKQFCQMIIEYSTNKKWGAMLDNATNKRIILKLLRNEMKIKHGITSQELDIHVYPFERVLPCLKLSRNWKDVYLIMGLYDDSQIQLTLDRDEFDDNVIIPYLEMNGFNLTNKDSDSLYLAKNIKI